LIDLNWNAPTQKLKNEQIEGWNCGLSGAVFVYFTLVFTHQEFNKSFTFVTHHFIIQRRREGIKMPQAYTFFRLPGTDKQSSCCRTDVITMSYVPIQVAVSRRPPAGFRVVLHPNAHLSFSATEDLITKETIVAI